MLLAIDIGNTNIVLGLFSGKQLTNHWRISADGHKTVDEYVLVLSAMIGSHKVENIIISSVVPPLLKVFQEVSRKCFNLSPLLVNTEMKTGISIKYPHPEELGADRIVNAVAAYHLYKEPVIVVDFGTATTLCVISEKGEYVGGVIIPGIGISVEALFKKTSLLPRIELTKPEKIIGENTVGSMQSGIIYGFSELVDGLVGRIKKERHCRFKVVATGGWAEVIASESKTIDKVEPNLTLEGLRILFDKNNIKTKRRR